MLIGIWQCFMLKVLSLVQCSNKILNFKIFKYYNHNLNFYNISIILDLMDRTSVYMLNLKKDNFLFKIQNFFQCIQPLFWSMKSRNTLFFIGTNWKALKLKLWNLNLLPQIIFGAKVINLNLYDIVANPKVGPCYLLIFIDFYHFVIKRIEPLSKKLFFIRTSKISWASTIDMPF